MEDIILKKGDIVKLKNGESFILVTWAGTSVKDYNSSHNEKIVEIKRPVKYETIYKKPQEILDKEEKEYLSAVIRPFRNRVEYIKKVSQSKYCEFIEMSVRYAIGTIYTGLMRTDEMYLPTFSKGSMYKGMEADRKYTLEELGL